MLQVLQLIDAYTGREKQIKEVKTEKCKYFGHLAELQKYHETEEINTSFSISTEVVMNKQGCQTYTKLFSSIYNVVEKGITSTIVLCETEVFLLRPRFTHNLIRANKWNQCHNSSQMKEKKYNL